MNLRNVYKKCIKDKSKKLVLFNPKKRKTGLGLLGKFKKEENTFVSENSLISRKTNRRKNGTY